eukprot:152947-Amorphochlora_amoeboformis.AAC.2
MSDGTPSQESMWLKGGPESNPTEAERPAGSTDEPSGKEGQDSSLKLKSGGGSFMVDAVKAVQWGKLDVVKGMVESKDIRVNDRDDQNCSVVLRFPLKNREIENILGSESDDVIRGIPLHPVLPGGG